ncbi:MAG: tRNA-guanine transglycosylase, partial [Parcubacteria group bacterium]|nr:tRNA-guanine transglycosylase [Parcubacteria group bacterium]
WRGPMLTDSGGFQVFSLANIRKILPEGVRFRSHIDGAEFLLTPKKALEIQAVIGSDIRMVLDVCAPYPCSRKEAERAVALTTKWAEISSPSCIQEGARGWLRDRRTGGLPPPNPLRRAGGGILYFAIIQGSTHKDLRLKSARELVALDFDGYAIGGLAVGESESEMLQVLDCTVPELPESKPRYLMGVGLPEQIIEAVKRGIDMFDCVIPTREARHGRLYVFRHGKFYETVSITNKKFSTNFTPINPASKLPELRNYTKAYLHHLFRVGEPLAARLATLNNVEFYLELMRRIRSDVRSGIL